VNRHSSAVFVALSLLTGVGMSACSTTGATAGQGPGVVSSAGEVLAVWQRFAACARTHGVPSLPDPLLNADGKASFPGFDERSLPDSVKTSCQGILARLPAGSSPNAQPAPTDIAALLQFAQCMRHHDFPSWPDPKSDGTFPAAQLPGMKTPALISGMKACDGLNPDKGGHVYGS